jgi:hypothetical protein
MKFTPRLLICLAAVTCWFQASGLSPVFSLAEKIDYCAVVAEVRVDGVQLQRDPELRLDELVCRCSILQGFKLPSATNSITLTFHYQDKALTYEGKTFLVFAFDHERGYRPLSGQAGMVEKGHPYDELVPPKAEGESYSHAKFDYATLIQKTKAIIGANKTVQRTGASRSLQTTNRAPSAAGSRR